MTLPKGEFAIEVMTGAPLPEDANAVIPVEKIDITEGYAMPHDNLTVDDLQFVHQQGSDCRQGDTVLPENTSLFAAELATAASVGADPISVRSLPNIHLITTGDEVIPPTESPTDFQIRRSLILTGGVSMGKFDWVAPLLNKLLGESAFHGISQKPGKPFAYWKPTASTPPIFALPGNPVSVMASMHRYVIPALRQINKQESTKTNLIMATEFQWNSPFTGILPYKLTNGAILIFRHRALSKSAS